MRDPEHIRKFCDQLADIWESQCPDWRFGQLVSNVQAEITYDLFYAEDDDMLKYFKKYFHLDDMQNKDEGRSDCEMALSRVYAIDRCIYLGRQFTDCFNRAVDDGVHHDDFSHYCHEMQACFNNVREIKLTQNNIRLSVEQLVDWFFTAGENMEDRIKIGYLDIYDFLIKELLMNGDKKTIENIMRKILKNERCDQE